MYLNNLYIENVTLDGDISLSRIDPPSLSIEHIIKEKKKKKEHVVDNC